MLRKSLQVITEVEAVGVRGQKVQQEAHGLVSGAGGAGERWHKGRMGRWLAGWRSWDPRLAWVGAVDIAGTLLLLGYVLGGHDRAALTVVVVLAWLAVVPAITYLEVVRVRRRRRAAG